MTDAALRDEVVGLARALIEVDTSNPPGRETAAARLLADYLEAAGVRCELVGPDPERLNLIARIDGRRTHPSVLVLGHTDVVPAPPAGWSSPPFTATLRDGALFGRGAADMKGELAARAVAVAQLARSGPPPEGDVVLVAASDEEDNAAPVGMAWLARERPDVCCDYALNEGGGLLLRLADGRTVVTLATGEKQVGVVRLRVFGRGGHASVPSTTSNAVLDAARAVERLLAYQPPVRVLPVLRRALDALGAPEGEDGVAWTAEQHPVLARLIPAMTRMTVTPTGLHAGEPPNVIPRHVDLVCDCRALPGQTTADVRDHVARALGTEITYDFEVIVPLVGGTESRIDTPLFRICQQYVERRHPGALLLPILCTGFTDSHFVRARGTVAYGFAPVFATDPETYLAGMHDTDEVIAVEDLVEMTRFHFDVLTTLWASR